MRKILFAIVLFPLSLMAQSLHFQTPIKFLALGDSYTIGESVNADQRWPEQLKDSLAKRGIVIDTIRYIATTGWTTTNLLSAITNQNLEAQHYNLVSLLIGVNDQFQNVPIAQYPGHFKQLLDSAIRYAGGDTSHVFIVSIPDYAYTTYGQQNNPSAISAGIDQYNAINKQYADSFHVQYFDITPISRLGTMEPFLVAPDGLHPSGIQYGWWVKLMMDYVDSNATAIDTVHTSIHTIADTKVEIYPNPTANEIVVRIGTGFDASTVIDIYDMNGKIVRHQKATDTTTTIATDGLSKGIYTVKISSKEKQVTRKVLKE